MTPLDPLSVDLRGVRLIEASAGTGKTHTIATLFVRLVLERRLGVDQILVVTFTNAATAELRDRIRKRLRDALSAFEGAPVADPSLRRLYERSPSRAADRRRLATALGRVDDAGVLTIHGFCQRILTEHAFDGGVRSNFELLPDLQPIVEDLVHDYFNSRFERASRAEIEYARSHGLGERALIKVALLSAAAPDAPVIVEEGRPNLAPTPALAAFFEARRRVVERWPAARAAIDELLRTTTALHRAKYHNAREQILASMDALALAGGESLGHWDQFSGRLSSREIAAGVNKGKVAVAPSHPLFALCDDLVRARERLDGELELWAQSVKAELAAHVRRELPKRTRERGVQSFDDLIHTLRNALRGPRGRALSAAIRRRFPAGLIDEFHDTDPVQYEIFRRIYRAKNTSLFLIGDPKQAIYSFRGADVLAYLGAAKDADSRETLGTNHRSDPTLVHALNTVFSRVPSPFLIDGIRFEPVAAKEGAEDRLRLNGELASGLDLVVVPRVAPAAEKPRRGGLSDDLLPPLVAAEIARYLTSDATLKTGGGSRKLAAGDFAVLVRFNREARAIQSALRVANIPSVLYGDASVLDTAEAHELGLVLQALADPSSATAIRSALATSLFGLSASELFALGDDEGSWELWANRFAAWHATWERRGVLAALRQLMRELGTSARLLRTIGGERKLTNFFHLTELCHRQASSAHAAHLVGVAGLLAWFGEVRHDDEAREGMAADAQQIRLESDAHAVQLTSIHRSKGLEYPLVVLPSMWRSASLFARDKPLLRYHDPARDHELVLDFRPEESKEAAIEHATEEAQAEGVRLAYVALTRARHRTIVLWGPFRGVHESSFGRLVHPTLHPSRGGTRRPAPKKRGFLGSPPHAGSALPSDLVVGNVFPDRLLAGGDGDSLPDATIWSDLTKLAADAGHGITIRRAEPGPVPRYDPPRGAPAPLAARAIERRLTTTFRTSSFSALTRGAAALGNDHDHDRDAEALEDDADDSAGSLRGERPASGVEAVRLDPFPRGPRAGDALHDILEHADFTPEARSGLRDVVSATLGRHGFDAGTFTDLVTESLSDALDTPLSPSDPTLTLSSVPSERRLSELEFTFPAAEAGRSSKSAVTASSLARVFAKREGAALPVGYASRVAALGFAPLAGFLRGFIDLVFEHDGRYYVVDYKSNHLGAAHADYAPDALAAPMADHHYYLQYHLYLVALHRYLSLRIANYDYDAHIGGVLYLFLRGMTKENGPKTGVHFDRPPLAVVTELSSLLSTGAAPDRRTA